MQQPERREVALGLMEGLRENLEWFPKYQAYLRQHQPPTLIVWGLQDGYRPAGAARAYLRDLRDAELHLLDGGHWALETNLDEIVPLFGTFSGVCIVQTDEQGARRPVPTVVQRLARMTNRVPYGDHASPPTKRGSGTAFALLQGYRFGLGRQAASMGGVAGRSRCSPMRRLIHNGYWKRL